MIEPIETNVPYVGGPMDGKFCPLLYCESESVCLPDATHHYKLVRVESSGAATLVYAGFIGEAMGDALTNEERNAIEQAVSRLLDAEYYGGPEPASVVTLRGLLKRLG